MTFSIQSSALVPISVITVTTSFLEALAGASSHELRSDWKSLPVTDYDLTLRKALQIFSPKAWLGILVSQTENVFNDFDATELAKLMLSLWIPCLAIVLTWWLVSPTSTTIIKASCSTMIRLVILSPWSFSILQDVWPQSCYLWNALTAFISTREPAFPEAKQMLQARIRDQAAVRSRDYDIYWPTTLSRVGYHHQGTAQRALLLLPGRGVSHTAYSRVAAKFADEHGYVVVVVSMEPFRRAHPLLGASYAQMQRLMQEVQHKFLASVATWTWALLGHSAGSFAAMNLFSEFCDSSSQAKVSVDKLVLWGCASIPALAADLSQLGFGASDRRILLLQGSDDAFVKMMSSNDEQFAKFFPQGNCETKYIEGGTHHGFACYQPSGVWNSSTETNPLPYEDQQRRACNITQRFLHLGFLVDERTGSSGSDDPDGDPESLNTQEF